MFGTMLDGAHWQAIQEHTHQRTKARRWDVIFGAQNGNGLFA